MWFLYVFVFLNLKYVTTSRWVPSEKLNQSLQVNTSDGLIQGIEKVSILGKTFFSYSGIPFAKPPIKNLRFRDPQPISKWSGVLDATVAGPCCAGLNVTALAQLDLKVSGDEDCLYLNVFSPKAPAQDLYKEELPVMMYVYGGGFLAGCRKEFEPDFFIENEVILVVPNYRLAALGYLSTEDMECAGNWAIKDLIAALKWIQTNIKQFGGDSKKVTIFGQSAGAANVNVILMSPKSIGLIHRAILMSGSILSFWAYHNKPRDVAFDVGVAVGIETNSSKILIEELRNVDSHVLVKSQLASILANFLPFMTEGLPFTPSIEPPHADAVWTSSEFSYELMDKGKFNKIPVMTGTTNMEMLMFNKVVDFLKPFAAILDMSPSLLVRMTKDSQNRSIVGNKIKDFFLQSRGFSGATQEELLKIFSEDAYWRPMLKMASLISKYCPVYFYQFAYEGPLGLKLNKRFNGLNERNIRGVGHSEDVYYLFHIKDQERNEDDMQISKKLAKIYTNFAKFGNPTPQLDTFLDNVTWPQVTNESFPYLKMEKQFRVMNENFDDENFQFWDGLFKTYGVGHSEDVYYLFHIKDQERNQDDMQISKKLAKIYTNFAKFGNPTPQLDTFLDNVTWPQVTKEKFPYLKMGKQFRVMDENFDEGNFQFFWEDLFKTYGQKPYKVY